MILASGASPGPKAYYRAVRVMARTIKLYVGIVLLGLVLLFSLQNLQLVPITFLVKPAQVPLFILLLGALVIGFIAGLVLGSVWSPRRRKVTTSGPPAPKRA